LKPNIAAILLTGGTGERFGSSLPKQFHLVAGKPLFIHTLEVFLQTGAFTKIILPVPSRWMEMTLTQIKFHGISANIEVIQGGKTRQESSYLGLLASDPSTEYVVIHDGVRPFVDEKILEENIREAILHNAVDTCIASADTLVHSPDGLWIDAIPHRKEFLRGQTPQSFSFNLILRAHEDALKNEIVNASDDCALVRRLGHPVKIVKGSERNIKVTTELDLFVAERLLQYPSEGEEPETSVQIPSLKGRVFAVTGGTGGIGRAICLKLIELGAIPIEISKTSAEFKADLTKYDEVEKVFDEIHKKYGPIDGLINSVGSFAVKQLPDLSEKEISNTIASNLTTVIYCCRSGKIKPGGHIVNIASSSYSRGRKEYPVYSAAKAAVVNFTQALAETNPDLYVNVIVPQRTNTPMRRTNFPEENPLSLLEPKEVAEKITRLLRSAKVSGTILEVRKKHAPKT